MPPRATTPRTARRTCTVKARGEGSVIAVSLRPTRDDWGKVSFASTLFLAPVLDLLLARVPVEDQPEVRLGLQEALVNAAKHGNNLDPSKAVVVHFCYRQECFTWVIADDGSGFEPRRDCDCPEELLPEETAVGGRGTCLLHHIFDRVYWNRKGTRLVLRKNFKRRPLRFLFWG